MVVEKEDGPVCYEVIGRVESSLESKGSRQVTGPGSI